MPRMLGIFSGREAQQFQDTVIIKKKVVKFGFLSERPWLIDFICLKEHSGPQLSDGQYDSSHVRCLKPGVLLENLGQRTLPSVNIVSWCENNQTILVH